MTKIVIAYHSGYGHTAKVAQAIAKGAQNANATVTIIDVSLIDEAGWTAMDEAQAIVFGSPTYMGSVSGPFEVFADATSKRWFTRGWKDKIAGGFTNSQNLSGDKLFTLQRLFILAMQHGMIWVGQAELPTGQSPDDVNRVSGYAGVMAVSENKSPDETPPQGDLKSAEIYGDRIARIAQKIA